MDFEEAEPVLAATYELLRDAESTTPDAVNEKLGREPGDEHTTRALALLYKTRFIGGTDYQNSPAPVIIEATEKGLQKTSGWPEPGAAGGDIVEVLLKLLDERIESPDTPEEEKGRLRRARDAFAGVTRDITVGVLSNLISKQTGVSD